MANKDVIILHDGSEVELEAGASLGALQVLSPDKAAMVAVWDRLTPANLTTARVKNGDGLVVGNYTDLVPADPVITAVHVNDDGSILITFAIREKTELERLSEQVAANTETLGIHDGAIGDMGAVISTVAAAQEGGAQ